MDYKVLEWDSNFFGFKTAEILPATLNKNDLSFILKLLSKKQVKLVYWKSSGNDKLNTETGKSLNGILVDNRITYCKDINGKLEFSLPDAISLDFYPQKDPNDELISLAIESGKYSRFKADPYFPQNKFIDLYSEWIKVSTLRTYAKETLTLSSSTSIVAFVTLGEKNGIGDIGLIAVNNTIRGKGFGKILLSAANNWFCEHGYMKVQVVTQGTNKQACMFYEKCNYQLIKSELVFHFWLQPPETIRKASKC